MKIGFSFGRCVRDIVKGDVKIEDVLCIVARTKMNSMDDVSYVINEYMYTPGYLIGLDEVECQSVARELFVNGKVHQPRAVADQYSRQSRIPNEFVWMDVVPSNINDLPAVKEAWENYQIMLRLTTSVPDVEKAPRD